jgi:hypothetical protein
VRKDYEKKFINPEGEMPRGQIDHVVRAREVKSIYLFYKKSARGRAAPWTQEVEKTRSRI